MASKTRKQNEELYTDYHLSVGAIDHLYDSFEEREKVLASHTVDQIAGKETKSRINDPTLLSAIFKQNNEVMAQMPTGKITALTKENRGKSLFMDLIFHKHVLPHATSQYDVFTKLWMLSMYRKVYGSMGALVDFVSGGGYGKGNAGPDFTILPIRSIIPQIGKYTISDSDYTYVRSRVTKKWLQDRDKNSWKNIDKVLETKGDFTLEASASSYIERKAEGQTVKRDEYELVTRYEPDRWTTFHPTTKEIIREIKNPQGNDQIPVIMCHSYPLLDRFIGLGDFERGLDLHSSLGSLISLYMDGAKAGIFPNLKIDPMAVENWQEIKEHGIGPGQIWLMKGTLFDKLEQMRVQPDLATFQNTYQFLKGAVLTLTNTTDTSVNSATDPGLGKTPQALKMQAFTQGMQTQFDRRMLEISTEQIFDRMIDLVAKRQEKPMELLLEEQDLLQVKEIAPDVVEMFEVGKMGKVVIKPQEIKNADYRYEIDQGSTTKKDDILENQTLVEVTTFVMKNIPGAQEALAGDGKLKIGSKVVDLGESIKRIYISSGVTDWDKIVLDDEQDESLEDDSALNMENPDTANVVNSAFAAPQHLPVTQPQPDGQAPMSGGVGFEDPLFSEVFSELQNLGQGGQA